MIKETISIDDAINLLNEMISLDKPAVAALLANRIPCNELVASHESIQVHKQHGGYWVGLIGVINGIFGFDEDGWGPIAYSFDSNGDLIRFLRTTKHDKKGGDK